MREIAEMVAGIRLDEVEHRMQTKTEVYTSYTDAIEAERIITQALLEKYGLDKVELDQLVSAVNASGAALAVEMYIEGFKARLAKDTSYKGLWTVSFTLREF